MRNLVKASGERDWLNANFCVRKEEVREKFLNGRKYFPLTRSRN